MPKYTKRSLAIAYQSGAEVSDAQGDEEGSFKVTSIINFGLSYGANPTNEAIVFS
jgi:hypothetical protein